MRVVFLDFDGVLNSWRYFKDAHTNGVVLAQPHQQIDKKAVRWLNEIIAASGAKVVISSTWRALHALEILKGWLADKGFTGHVIGATPTYSYDDACERGHEIDAWLKEHPGVESFVILDDGNDMAMHMARLVLIDARKGLKPKHVAAALALLIPEQQSSPPAPLGSTR